MWTLDKPMARRPCVPAYLDSGILPALTCDSLRFVCAFTRRRKVDLSTSSRTMLAFDQNASCSSSACSTPALGLR